MRIQYTWISESVGPKPMGGAGTGRPRKLEVASGQNSHSEACSGHTVGDPRKLSGRVQPLSGLEGVSTPASFNTCRVWYPQVSQEQTPADIEDYLYTNLGIFRTSLLQSSVLKPI